MLKVKAPIAGRFSLSFTRDKTSPGSMTAGGISMQGFSKMTPGIGGVSFVFGSLFYFAVGEHLKVQTHFRTQLPSISRMERSELPLGLLPNQLLLECVCEVPKPQNTAIRLKGEQAKM